MGLFSGIILWLYNVLPLAQAITMSLSIACCTSLTFLYFYERIEKSGKKIQAKPFSAYTILFLAEGRERKWATVDTLVTLHDVLMEDTPILWVMRAA